MSYLQVASWNIEHLSGQPRATRAQSAFALADHIEMAGIDLIALQEIYVTPANEQVRLFPPRSPVIDSRATGALRNAELDVVCYLLEEHLDEPWKYTLLQNRVAGDRSQLCAVLWNAKRLKLKEPITVLPVKHKVDGLPLWDRKPHLLSFSTKIKVWRRNEAGVWEQQDENRTLSVVPLHMKSNVGGVTVNRRVRGLEAATLCDALEQQRATPGFDPSLVLLGDTNILKNDEPAIETFIDRGFVDLNNNDGATYWSRDFGQAPFDRIFVAKGRPEFRYSRQYILRSSDLERHDRFLSDHYMVKMSVKDYVDDRDPRPPN